MQNLPIFENQGGARDNVERLMSGTQTVIPDYSFDCYGNVTQWGAFVERHNGNIRYSLDFQVWRRSGGGQGTTGEYDFVGNNSFQSIDPPGGGRINKTVPMEDQIKVRPGDVIGLYITTSSDNGVELKQQDRNGDTLIIWFATSLTAALSTRIGVGSTSGYKLTATTTAVPVITAVVVPSTPSPSPTPLPLPTPSPSPIPLPLSPGLPTLNTVLVTTSRPSLFLPSPDTTSPPVGSGLELVATVAIVIIVLIVVVLGVLILVFVLALALRRRSKKQVLMVNSSNNPEYSGKLLCVTSGMNICVFVLRDCNHLATSLL